MDKQNEVESLKSLWTKLTSSFSSDSDMIEDFWEEIEKSYTHKERHYHNLSHLAYMLEKAQQHASHIEDFPVLQFSIFYHDIIYNAQRQDNEEKSAEVAQSRLAGLGLSETRIQKCFDQIIATKSHKSEVDNDIHYLLDFDLGILGESYSLYEVYTQNIRKEYSIYPDFMYKKGREKVLQHFLDMERIFKTEAFYSQYENQAKENLKTELDLLKK